MIIDQTGGNPNLYGSKWNHQLGCLGRLRLPGRGLSGDAGGIGTGLVLLLGLWFLPKLLKGR